jgi:hypothetical protein
MPDTPQDFINPFEGIDMDSLKTHARSMANRFNSILSANLVAECEKPEVRQAILYRIDYKHDFLMSYYTFLAPPIRYCLVFSIKGLKDSIYKIKNKHSEYSSHGFEKMSLLEAGATSNFIVDCYRIPKRDGLVTADISRLVNEWEIFVKDANCDFENTFGIIILDQWQVVYDYSENVNAEISQLNNKLGSSEAAKRFLQDNGLPSNFKWNLIKFILKSDYLIIIEVPTQNWRIRASYHDLGMVDRRKGDEPSKLWIALRTLCKFNGCIKWSNTESVEDKKTLSRLSKFMKECFGIDDNFIERYSKKHGYVAKSSFTDRRGEDSLEEAPVFLDTDLQ